MHMINSQTKRQDSEWVRAIYEVAKLDGYMHSIMLGGEIGKHMTDFVFLSMNDKRQALNALRGFAKNGAELREATTAI